MWIRSDATMADGLFALFEAGKERSLGFLLTRSIPLDCWNCCVATRMYSGSIRQSLLSPWVSCNRSKCHSCNISLCIPQSGRKFILLIGTRIFFVKIYGAWSLVSNLDFRLVCRRNLVSCPDGHPVDYAKIVNASISRLILMLTCLRSPLGLSCSMN